MPAPVLPPRVRGLASACHPMPAVAVTAFAAALVRAAGGRRGQVLAAASAVAAGQLAIGWANDAVDAEVDAAAGRATGPGAKPVAAGLVTAREVGVAAVAATVAAVPLSLAAGPRAGRLHLAALAAGLGYDLGLKGTVASPLPYAAFFSCLPAVAALAAGRAPVPVLCAAAGTLGVGAHFANTLKDADADAATGVRGLPQVVGPRASRVVAGALVTTADALLLVGRPGRPGRPGRAVLPAPARALLAASALTGTAGSLRGGAGAFRAVLGAAGLAVAGVLAGARELHERA